MLAKPSPRKPMLATCSKSFKVLILLVAWRWSASSMSSGWIPLPLSLTRIRRMPPPASSTSIAVAPASILFSTISFRALAGRSTTSPAAIWLTRWSGRAAIRDIRRASVAKNVLFYNKTPYLSARILDKSRLSRLENTSIITPYSVKLEHKDVSLPIRCHTIPQPPD